MNGHTANIKRVRNALQGPILVYRNTLGTNNQFSAQDLRDFVDNQTGEDHAPASAQRIMQLMRTLGELDYEVTNRRRSLYRFVPDGTTTFFNSAHPVVREIHEGDHATDH
jgi:hypothetical protein